MAVLCPLMRQPSPKPGGLPPPAVMSAQLDAWRRWQALSQYLSRGGVAIIDGATGTEIERRAGATTMVSGAWSALSNLTVPRVVEQVHTAYLEAGADIIVANTYATNPNVMDAAGFGDKQQRATTAAVTIARQARDQFAAGRPKKLYQRLPLVAGSLSCHPPGMKDGSEVAGGEAWPAPEVEEANLQRHAELLRSAGVDVIFLEMVWDMSHGVRAVRAACSVDLPVFVSVCLPTPMRGEIADQVRTEIACGVDVKLGGLGSVTVRDAVRCFTEFPNVVGVNVHHTKLPFVLPALRAVRDAGWRGPLGCYPDHGTFRHPHWEYEHLSTRDLAEAAEHWVEDCGVQLIGGCCGIGPHHIAELSRHRDALAERLQLWRTRPAAGRDASSGRSNAGPTAAAWRPGARSPLPGTPKQRSTTPPPSASAAARPLPRSLRDAAVLAACGTTLCLLMAVLPGMLRAAGDARDDEPQLPPRQCGSDWASLWHRSIDADVDGRISRTEWRDYLRTHHKLRRRLAHRHRPIKQGDRLFNYLDADGDQQIGAREFEHRWEELLSTPAKVDAEQCPLPATKGEREEPFEWGEGISEELPTAGRGRGAGPGPGPGPDPGPGLGGRGRGGGHARPPQQRVVTPPPQRALGPERELKLHRKPGQSIGLRLVGLVVAGVAPRSPALRGGATAGMVVRRVGGRAVTTQAEAERELEAARGQFSLVVALPPAPHQGHQAHAQPQGQQQQPGAQKWSRAQPPAGQQPQQAQQQQQQQKAGGPQPQPWQPAQRPHSLLLRGRRKVAKGKLRTTLKGCPCRQRWTLAAGQGMHKLCGDACCAFSDPKPWCFVQSRTCEGYNWGYCAPLGRRVRRKEPLPSSHGPASNASAVRSSMPMHRDQVHRGG